MRRVEGKARRNSFGGKIRSISSSAGMSVALLATLMATTSYGISVSRSRIFPAVITPPALTRIGRPLCTAPAPLSAMDLVGDGGVLKSVMAVGTGSRPPRGSSVEVHYEGTLVDTGEVFDSSRKRGKTFRFKLGEGKVRYKPEASTTLLARDARIGVVRVNPDDSRACR